jgi:RNA ligase (TIGR02306 family)
MATIEVIKEINDHPNADVIELAKVRGWQCVVRKGDFSAGDKVVFCEIDSWIPNDLAPFLSKGDCVRDYNGIKGNRLRTVRLRGEISQGLVLPIDKTEGLADRAVGEDVSKELNIVKWEPEIPASLSGVVVGQFPTHIVPKTDEERVQNIFESIDKEDLWEVSIKIDGSSMTIIHFEEEIRVCSRNLELKFSKENESNTFVTMTRLLKEKIIKLSDEFFKMFGHKNFAIQGELYGPGIQGNPEKSKRHRFAVYNIYNINDRCYLKSKERLSLCDKVDLKHVPILFESIKAPDSMIQMLMIAEGKSIRAKEREGVVFKSLSDPGKSFKVISNKYLLKTERG